MCSRSIRQESKLLLAAAADLLRVYFFLHLDDIPEEFITKETQALEPRLKVAAQSPPAFNQAIGVLHSYSLLKRNTEDYLRNRVGD